jgi:hypothetical protein
MFLGGLGAAPASKAWYAELTRAPE